jgi:uncharacterized repeat protein (TIGR01451 family)
MSAFNRGPKKAFTIALIIVFLFNTVGASPASAQVSINSENISQASNASISIVDRILELFHVNVNGPDAQATETEILQPGSTPIETITPEPSFTPTATQDPLLEPTGTATPTGTTVPSVTASSLDFSFAASPGQAAPGDEVTFTITVKNNTDMTATGIVFTNTLPGEFSTTGNGLGDFQYDQETRLLSWNGTKGVPGSNSLKPGETLSLQYSVKVDSKLDIYQVKDVASLTADGWSDPLLAAALLTVTPANEHLTAIGP